MQIFGGWDFFALVFLCLLPLISFRNFFEPMLMDLESVCKILRFWYLIINLRRKRKYSNIESIEMRQPSCYSVILSLIAYFESVCSQKTEYFPKFLQKVKTYYWQISISLSLKFHQVLKIDGSAVGMRLVSSNPFLVYFIGKKKCRYRAYRSDLHTGAVLPFLWKMVRERWRGVRTGGTFASQTPTFVFYINLDMKCYSRKAAKIYSVIGDFLSYRSSSREGAVLIGTYHMMDLRIRYSKCYL